jgi:hypothetical protein
LIDNEFVPILIFFSWPARIAGLAGPCGRIGSANFKRRANERGGDEQALEESGVKDFHDAKKEASHIGGAIAYKTLGQYGEEAALIVFAVQAG